jgi:FtsH-binding integral membrane protein
MSPQVLLKFALAAFGTVFLLVYPLAIVWPSGWAWHAGPPDDSQYFMMIVGVYATLGVFLLMAARNPQVHRSLIWFTVWSSIVHGAIMAVQSMPAEHHGHLLGDVPALFLVAGVLGGLLAWSDADRMKAA